MSIHLFSRNTWGSEELVSVTPSDRRFHTYVVGKTGSGKTTLLRNILVQEIEQGAGVGLIDPHGDLSLEILDLVPPSRFGDVVYFDPGSADAACALNVVRNGFPPDLVASSVVGSLRNIFRDSWGPRLEHILYAAIAALAHCQNVSLLSVPRLLVNSEYRGWVVNQVTDPAVRDFWTVEFESYDKRLRAEAVAPVLNKVGQFLMSPSIRNVLGQVRNRIDFRTVLDHGQIFIANLSKSRLGEEKSSLLGALLVSQFELACMARASVPQSERRDFGLCIDEFQNFGTESLCTILSEARKYGLNLTLAHQYVDQVRPEIRAAILGNVGSLISFRVGSSDAEILAREFGDNTQPVQLADLDRFEVMARIMRSGELTLPFTARTLPPLGKSHGGTKKIMRRSNERFARPRCEVERKLASFLRSST